jgi:hypothetical protein
MSETSRVVMTDEDNSSQIMDALLGISGISGVFLRGPIGKPSRVFSTPAEFQKIYGGDTINSDDALQCIRHLERGGKIRVNGVRHYTDPNTPSTLTAIKAAEVTALNTGGTTPVFGLIPKNPGANYNRLVREIKPASNGLTANGYFDLDVYINNEKDLTLESYKNLRVVGNPTINQSTYLKDVVANSDLVDVLYKDLSATTGQVKPIVGSVTFTGGTDGGAIVPADYIGTQTGGTGFYAWDNYDDMMQIAVPNISDPAVNNAGAVYADARQDIMFFAHLDHTLTSVDAIIAQRAAVTIDTKYVAFFTGGVVIKDPLTGGNRVISEIADILGIASYVDEKFGPWFSMANFVRGFIPKAVDVPNNFGSKGNYSKLNSLAQRQINCTVASSGKIYLSGNFSGQVEESKASYMNVVRLLIFIKKTIGPTLVKYLEEPGDLATFKALHFEVQPFFENLKNSQRALHEYKWDGDQGVDNIKNVVVNTLTDLDKGKYKVKLYLEPIIGLGEIAITISLNRTGEITFGLDDNL